MSTALERRKAKYLRLGRKSICFNKPYNKHCCQARYCCNTVIKCESENQRKKPYGRADDQSTEQWEKETCHTSDFHNTTSRG